MDLYGLYGLYGYKIVYLPFYVISDHIDSNEAVMKLKIKMRRSEWLAAASVLFLEVSDVESRCQRSRLGREDDGEAGMSGPSQQPADLCRE